MGDLKLFQTKTLTTLSAIKINLKCSVNELKYELTLTQHTLTQHNSNIPQVARNCWKVINNFQIHWVVLSLSADFEQATKIEKWKTQQWTDNCFIKTFSILFEVKYSFIVLFH